MYIKFSPEIQKENKKFVFGTKGKYFPIKEFKTLKILKLNL